MKRNGKDDCTDVIVFCTPCIPITVTSAIRSRQVDSRFIPFYSAFDRDWWTLNSYCYGCFDSPRHCIEYAPAVIALQALRSYCEGTTSYTI